MSYLAQGDSDFLNSIGISAMKIIISVCLFTLILSGCVSAPTPEMVKNANYGTPPDKDNLKEFARKRLRDQGYLDPNNTEIENCDEPRQTWQKGAQYTDMSNFDSRETIFGYAFSCDVNAPNAFGGKTGFKRVSFFTPGPKVR